MNNLQLYVAIGLPVIAVLASQASLTISLIQISAIREDIRGMRADFRADLRDLTGKVIEIDNRLTRIEERMAH